MQKLQEMGKRIWDSVMNRLPVRRDRPRRPSCFDYPLKVLCILRDQPSMSDLVRHTLEAKGCQVVICPDGVRGLGLARAEQPDVVIVDELSPSLDGYKVYTAMKADDYLCQVPLVFVQSRAVPYWPGAPTSPDIIHMPFGPRELTNTIEWVMSNRPDKVSPGGIRL